MWEKTGPLLGIHVLLVYMFFSNSPNTTLEEVQTVLLLTEGS